MTGTLTCRITPKPPDFDYVPVLDIWCVYDFILTQNQTDIVLLHHEWDFVCFCKWVATYAEYWLTDTLSIQGYTDSVPVSNESLSQTLDRLYDRDFEDEVEEDFWYESLRHYQIRHSLSYGLPGAAIPRIIIGYGNHVGEISWTNDKGDWVYTFAMLPFVETTIAEVQRVLNIWEVLEKDSRAIPLIANLHHRLAVLTEKLAEIS